MRSNRRFSMIELPGMLFFFTIILLVINTLSLSNIDLLRQIGREAMHLTLWFYMGVFAYYYIYHRNYTGRLIYLYIASLMIMFVQIISMFINGDSNITLLIKVFNLLLFITLSSQFKWKADYFVWAGYLISIITLYLFYDWNFSNLSGQKFSSIYRNPNTLAIFLFCSLYFIFLAIYYSKKYSRVLFTFIALLVLFLISTTKSRTVILALAIVLLAGFIHFMIPKLFKWLFHIIILFNFLFVFIYIKLWDSNLAEVLNNWSQTYFGKDFYSGRNVIWLHLWPWIQEKSVLGYGISQTAHNLTPLNHGSHNQFIQIILEVGLIGLLCYLFLFYSLWNLLLKSQATFEGKLSAYFFLSFLMYGNFETILFQNGFQIAFIQWIIITLGISFIVKHPNNSRVLRVRTL